MKTGIDGDLFTPMPNRLQIKFDLRKEKETNYKNTQTLQPLYYILNKKISSFLSFLLLRDKNIIFSFYAAPTYYWTLYVDQCRSRH